LTHLYLIRHGDSLETVQDGKTVELGLSPEGIRQSELLRDRLLRTSEIQPDVLLTSGLQRARETADILASAFAHSFIVDADFEEWRSDQRGDLSAEEFSALWANTPDAQKPYLRFVPGGETWLEFSVRIQQALNRVLQQHEGKTIALVAHGGVIQASFLYFFGYTASVLPRAGVDVGNTSITHWYKSASRPRWVLERFNDTHHLQTGG
jgi:2,3-bisphosphoglycerate-dependent phosphoglycerate mutase